MKSFLTLAVAAAGLLDLANAFPNVHHAHLKVRQNGQYKTMSNKGCYSSNGGAIFNSSSVFNTEGDCQHKCVDMGKPMVFLHAGSECWCGDLMPNILTKVANSTCNVPCPGSAADPDLRCGGMKGFWNVYNDALYPVDPDQAPVPTPTNSASGKGTAPTSGSTAGTTTSPTTSPESTANKKSGPNVAAIAAGVVVGLVLIAAIAAGVFIYVRNQKRREIEEEHRRSAAASSLAAAEKAHMSAASSFTDTRLDPVVMGRRESTGSIADNQDYSRRILKVTNA